jgi:hypothetical protein
VRADDLEVWVCPVPPTGEQLCIPVYDGLLEAVGSDLAKINLADCPDAGPCRVFQQVGELDGEQLCFVVGDAGLDPSCEIGCALIPQQQLEAGLPPWALPLGLLLLLLLLLLIIILLLTRRRREEEEETAA